MHKTAMKHGRLFFETYVRPPARILDIGAQDVNGSLRSVAPPECDYVGVDFVASKGVDVIIEDPYVLPFPDESFDIAVTSSCYEHSEFFWLTFLENLRVLKSDGLLYINVPSNGIFHRYPVDCWRFYPDSGMALQNWSRRSGGNALLLESFIGMQDSGVYNDFVAVFVKDAAKASAYPSRIIERFDGYTNGRLAGRDDILKTAEWPQDALALSSRIRRRANRLLGRPLE